MAAKTIDDEKYETAIRNLAQGLAEAQSKRSDPARRKKEKEPAGNVFDDFKEYSRAVRQNSFLQSPEDEDGEIIKDAEYTPESIYSGGLMYCKPDGIMEPLMQVMERGESIIPENITIVPSHVMFSPQSKILPAPELTAEQLFRLEKQVDAAGLSKRISDIMLGYKMDTYDGVAGGDTYERSVRKANVKLFEAIRELASEYSPMHGILTSPDPDIRIWGIRKTAQILEQAAAVYEKDCLRRIEKISPDVLRRKQQSEREWFNRARGMSRMIYDRTAEPHNMMGILCFAAIAGPWSVLIFLLPLMAAMLETKRAHRRHLFLERQAQSAAGYIAREKSNAMAIRIMGNMALPEVLISLASGESPAAVLAKINGLSEKYSKLTDYLEDGLYSTLFRYESQKARSGPLSPGDPQLRQLNMDIKKLVVEVLQGVHNPELFYKARSIKSEAMADWDISRMFKVEPRVKTDAINLDGLSAMRHLTSAIKNDPRSQATKTYVPTFNPPLDGLAKLPLETQRKITAYANVLFKYTETIRRTADLVFKEDFEEQNGNKPPTLANAFKLALREKSVYEQYMLQRTPAGIKKNPNADTIPIIANASLLSLKQALAENENDMAAKIKFLADEKLGSYSDFEQAKVVLDSSPLPLGKDLKDKLAEYLAAYSKNRDEKSFMRNVRDALSHTDDAHYLARAKIAVAPLLVDMSMRVLPPETWESILKLEKLGRGFGEKDKSKENSAVTALDAIKAIVIASEAERMRKSFEEKSGREHLATNMYDITKGFALQILTQYYNNQKKAHGDGWSMDKVINDAVSLLGEEDGKDLRKIYSEIKQDIMNDNSIFLEGKEEHMISRIQEVLNNETKELTGEQREKILSQARMDGVKIIANKQRTKTGEDEAIDVREQVAVLAEQLSGAFNMTATTPLLGRIVQTHTVGFSPEIGVADDSRRSDGYYVGR